MFRNKKLFVFFISIMLLFLFSIDIVAKVKPSILIKNPQPTCEEKLYTELKFVNEIREDIDDDFFLAVPLDVVADSEGNVYVFDKKQFKVLKYDKNLKGVAQYGKNGTGPGEFGARGLIYYFSMAIGYDNMLYIGDRFNKTLHCLTRDLEFRRDIKIKEPMVPPFFVPTPGNDGFFYTTCADVFGKGLIAQFNLKGERVGSLIDREEMRFQLYYELDEMARDTSDMFSPAWISFDVTKGDILVVYTSRAGLCYLIKDGKVLKKMKLWPKNALALYKSHLKSTIDRSKNSFYPFFCFLFVDRDDENYFYLCYGKPDKDYRTRLYKYDLEGNLIKVIFINNDRKYGFTHIKYKRNNLFYGIGKNKNQEITIKTYKEVIK